MKIQTGKVGIPGGRANAAALSVRRRDRQGPTTTLPRAVSFRIFVLNDKLYSEFKLSNYFKYKSNNVRVKKK